MFCQKNSLQHTKTASEIRFTITGQECSLKVSSHIIFGDQKSQKYGHLTRSAEGVTSNPSSVLLRAAEVERALWCNMWVLN